MHEGSAMQDLNMLLEPARALLQEIGAFLPRLLVAVGVLIVGWLIAKATRFTAVKAMRAFNFHVLTERAGIDGFLQQGGTEKDATDVFGAIVYWLVILAALIVAFNGLGLSQVTDLLTRVLLFLPKLLVALVLLIVGAYFGRFVGQAVTTYLRNAEIADAGLLGHAVQYAIVAFVILLAFDHLDIGGGLIQNTFLILLAGVVLALALAFGIGGRDWAAALLDRWWPREHSAANDATRPRDRP
jgi:flagellar biosynthesis protein FliQ